MFYEKFSGNSFTYLRFVFSMLVLIPPFIVELSVFVVGGDSVKVVK